MKTVVPRILFDGWLPQHIQELEVHAARDKVIKLISNVVKVRQKKERILMSL